MDRSPPDILFICSLSKTLHSFEEILSAKSVTAVLADSLRDAEPILTQRPPAVVVCASELVDGTYRDVLRILHRAQHRVPVLVVNLIGRDEECKEARRLGAADCLPRPMNPEDVEGCLERAFKLLPPRSDTQRA